MADSWSTLLDAISVYLKTLGYNTKDNLFYTQNTGDTSFFLVPLSRIEKLRELRKEDKYSSPAIILISGKHQNPYRDNADLFPDDKKGFFGNPGYGNIKKAILYGELKKLYGPDEFVIDATLSDLKQEIENTISNLTINNNNYRKYYYDAFIGYYFPKEKDEVYDISDKKHIKFKANYAEITNKDFKIAEKAYCKLNGIDYDAHVHRVKFELFRAPVPFHLKELLNAKKVIEEALDQGNTKRKIKFLLIDNRIDKIKPRDQKSSLIETLEKFNLQSISEIEMLGNIVYKTDNTGQPQCYKREFNNGVVKESEFDIKELPDKSEENFDCDEFKRQLKSYLKDENAEISTYKYLLNVYKKIKSSHFVFLDFFLDEENTYLAFDFIKDVSEIKKKKGDYSTTWYFITSAVYDSVVKYSQSGLLAEFYESAVVNAGDDPTNEKRQIIFIYKLLTFIKSRIANFSSFKNIIHQRLLGDWKENDNDALMVCCKNQKNRDSKEGNEFCRKIDNCLENILTDIKRYLTEYEGIYSLLYHEDDKKGLKEIIESLENLIKQFIWLPEADWQIIQHQIDFVNSRLANLKDANLSKCKFSCNYINQEIKDRSEIY